MSKTIVKKIADEVVMEDQVSQDREMTKNQSTDNGTTGGDVMDTVPLDGSESENDNHAAGPTESGFRSMPLLSRAFERERVRGKSYRNTCKFCKKTLLTNDTKRLVHHLKTCKKFKPDNEGELSVSFSNSRQQEDEKIEERVEECNMMLAELIVDQSLSPTMVDSKTFRAFISCLNPLYKLPTGRVMVRKYLPMLAEKNHPKTDLS